MTKHTPSPVFINKRTKKLELFATVDQLLGITKAIINFTVSPLQMSKFPRLDEELLPTKTLISKLMSAEMEKVLNPDFISTLTLSVFPNGGFFSIEIEYCDGSKNDQGQIVIEKYKVTLSNKKSLFTDT